MNNNKKLSFPKFVVGNLPLSKSLLKEEKQHFFNGKVEDPRQKHSGMTPNFMGFTLIELLVVVLIIGILAAVAVPKYQKAVEKSRAAQAISLVKAAYQAQLVYYLANGTTPTSLDELAIDIPWTGNQCFIKNCTSARSNGIWSLELYEDSEHNFGIQVGRITGKYAGTGFMIFTKAIDIRKPGQLWCVERTGGTNFSSFQGNTGDYCQKIFAASTKQELTGTLTVFPLP